MTTTETILGQGVVSAPGIRGGKPVLAGTGVPVHAIVEMWQLGYPIEMIPVHLPHLQLTQVLEALHYYLNHRDEIEGYIAADRVPHERSGKRYNPATDSVED
jgi:uncharacterized protein (DUF433 family)